MRYVYVTFGLEREKKTMRLYIMAIDVLNVTKRRSFSTSCYRFCYHVMQNVSQNRYYNR